MNPNISECFSVSVQIRSASSLNDFGPISAETLHLFLSLSQVPFNCHWASQFALALPAGDIREPTARPDVYGGLLNTNGETPKWSTFFFLSCIYIYICAHMTHIYIYYYILIWHLCLSKLCLVIAWERCTGKRWDMASCIFWIFIYPLWDMAWTFTSFSFHAGNSTVTAQFRHATKKFPPSFTDCLWEMNAVPNFWAI